MLGKLIPIVSVANETNEPIVGITTGEGEIIVATNKTVYLLQVEKKAEKPKKVKLKGNDGKLAVTGLNPEDDGRRAGKELPPGYIFPSQPKEKKK